MKRRDLLRLGGTALVAGVAGTADIAGTAGSVGAANAAGGRSSAGRTRDVTESPTATGSPSDGTPADGVTATPEGYGPLGSVGLGGAKEAVVGEEGTTVYVAVTDGFAVVDAGDPGAPRVIYENRRVLDDVAGGPLQDIFDVKVDGNRLAVTGPGHPVREDVLMAVAVYDVSDPAAPERVAVHRTDFFNHNCFIRDGVVYLCGNYLSKDEPNSLVTVDAATGEELGRWSIVEVEPGWMDVQFGLWPLHDVWVGDGIAYLAHWDAGTWMVDVSDPAAPEPVAKVRGRPPSAFADLSGQEAGREETQPPGNDHLVQASADGSLVVIGVEAWDADADDGTGRPGGVHLYDVSAPAKPEKLAFLEPPPTPDPTRNGVWTTSHNFEVDGDRLYTSWYRGGVRTFDISEPTRPELLAAWRNSASTSFWTAQGADGFVVASSRKNPDRDSSSGTSGGAAIYTFPEPHVATPTATPTPTPTRSTTPTTQDPPADDGQTETDAPGFGPIVTLAGAGLGAWRYARRRED